MPSRNVTTRQGKPVLALLSEGVLDTEFGEFDMSVFHDGRDEAVVLSKGELYGRAGVICRIHSECLSAHVFSGVICDCKEQMTKSQQLIVKEGLGLIIYLRQEGRGLGAAAHVATLNLKRGKLPVPQSEAYTQVGFLEDDTRQYDIAANIIKFLGIKSIKLVSSNARKIEAMSKHHIEIDERINFQGCFSVLGPSLRNIADAIQRNAQDPIMRAGQGSILVIGDMNIDYVIPAAHLERIQGQILVMGEPSVGGTAINAATAFRDKGFEPVIFGKIGDDREGQLIRDEIERRKITTLAGVTKTKSTGSCFVIFERDTQQRLMIQESAKANANDYDLDNLALALQMCKLRHDHLVFVVGHFLVRLDLESAKLLIELLAQARARIVLDIVPHDMWRYIDYHSFIDVVDERIQVLVGEYDAFMRLLGHQNIKSQPDSDDWVELFRRYKAEILIVRYGMGNIAHQVICKRMRAKDLTMSNLDNVYLHIEGSGRIAEIRDLLDRRLSDDALTSLCSCIGLSSAVVLGQNKTERNTSLINHCNQNDLLPLLIACVQHEYPHISWPSWLQGYKILDDKATGYEKLEGEQKRGFGDRLTAEALARFRNEIPSSISGHDVFVSYSHQDEAIMRRIKTSLINAGLRVWVDETGITMGTPSWKNAIEEAIVASKCLAVILSPEASGSRWVREEISYAENHGKPVFPILIRGDKKNAVMLGLSNAQFTDIRDEGKYDERMADLVETISQFIKAGQV